MIIIFILHNLAPNYIKSLLTPCEPGRALRSAGSNLLRVTGPSASKLQNSLLAMIKSTDPVAKSSTK